MFTNRVFLGIGKGEALTEVTSGQNWPSGHERPARLKEAVCLIKKLWTEDWVDFKGTYYWVKDSKLYIKPKKPIPLYIAGLGPQTAKFAGEEGDGFVTNELDIDIKKANCFQRWKRVPRILEKTLVHWIDCGVKRAEDFFLGTSQIWVPHLGNDYCL